MAEIQLAARDDFWLSTPGTWRPGIADDGHRTATMSCPECGAVASLRNHEINDKGVVNPSVVCESCDFHDYVKLVGWEARA